MIVSDIRTRSGGGVARVEARVEWENTDRAPLVFFVETEERFGDALTPDPNAVLIACLLPAWRVGERRVRVEGTLCPILCEGVKTPLGMIRSWFDAEFGPPPTIVADGGYEVREPIAGRGCLSLLSCGIDSLATLRWNMLHIPRTHPDAIGACVYFGLDDFPEPSLERLHEITGPRVPAVAAVTADAGVEAIPIRSNFWYLTEDGWFYTLKWHGAVLASLLTFFSGGYRKGFIASSHSPAVVQPYGSHPLLDPYFSTGHFQIAHDLFGMSRREKIAMVSEWPAGVANIRVCQNDNSGSDNCGTCEKCIRTQVQLAALGRLEAGAASFPHTRLSPKLVATIDEYDMIRGHPYFIAWYREAIPELRQHGYDNVADALEAAVVSAEQANVGRGAEHG